MMSFRKGTSGTPTAARAMADHLFEQTLSKEAGALASYYLRSPEAQAGAGATGSAGAGATGSAGAGATGSAAEPRLDMHPRVAEALRVAPGKALTHAEVVSLLSGAAADGTALPGAQRGAAYADRESITYYDFTFSAPKHVSVAMALAETDAERFEIVALHRASVREAMGYLEQIIGFARKGKAGCKGAVPGHIGYFSFDHYTARPTLFVPYREESGVETTLIATVRGKSGLVPGDPQLHTHVLTPNVVVCADGSVGSLDTAALHDVVKEVGGLYQAIYAQKLRSAGIGTGLDPRTGLMKLPEVGDDLCELFSRRTRDGKRLAREYVKALGLDWDALHPLELVKIVKGGTRAAREGKGDDLADVASWRAQAAAAGHSYPGTVRTQPTGGLPAPEEERIPRAYAAALPLLEQEWERRAVMPASVARVIATRGLIVSGIADPQDINRVTAMMRDRGVVHEGKMVRLIWGEVEADTGDLSGIAGTGRRQRYKITTALHARHERDVIDLAAEAATDTARALTLPEIDHAVATVSARDGLDFTTPHGRAQREVMDALGTAGRFAVAVGVAGAGKTTLLRPLVEAWQSPPEWAAHATPREVYGIAIARRQSDQLVDAGIPAARTMPVYQFLRRAGKQGRHGIVPTPDTVVVVDEVSQIGTRQLLSLARAQRRFGFSIVAIGDDRQNQSIEAGNSIHLLQRALKRQGVPELHSSVRQIRQRDQDTALLFRAGRAADAIARLREDGHTVVTPGGREEAIAAVVALWRERRRLNAGREGYAITISAPTNEDARDISAAIRQGHRAAGRLGVDLVRLDATDQGKAEFELPLTVGDRVRLFNIVRASYGDGHAGNLGANGAVLDVLGIDPAPGGGLSLRNKHGSIGFVTWDALRDPDNGRIRLSYGDAVTIDAVQGSTATEHINALVSGSSASHSFRNYPAQSRARETTYMVVSQGLEVQEVMRRRAQGSTAAITDEHVWDNVATNLSRMPTKELALELLDYANEVYVGMVDGFAAAHHGREARTAWAAHHADAPAAQAGEARAGASSFAAAGATDGVGAGAGTTLHERFQQSRDERAVLQDRETVGRMMRRVRRKRITWAPPHEQAARQAREQAVRERRSMRAAASRPSKETTMEAEQPGAATAQAAAPGTGQRRRHQSAPRAESSAPRRERVTGDGPRPAPPSPRRARRVITPTEARAEFMDALDRAGIVLLPREKLRTDGERAYAQLQGSKPSKRNALYRLHLDAEDRAHGFIMNLKTGEKISWQAGAAYREQSPEDMARVRAQREADRAARVSEQHRRENEVAAKSLATWNRSRPASPQHPYLVKKNVGGDTLRQNRRGELLVPMRDVDGTMWGVQRISPEGGKMFPADGRKQGTFFTLGTIEPGQPIVIGEGYATVKTVREATGFTAVGTFDSGNLDVVARALHARYPESPLVFAVDNDHALPRREAPLENVGRVKAEAAAAAVGGILVMPRFGALETGPLIDGADYPTDYNDFRQRNGLTAVRADFEAALKPHGITMADPTEARRIATTQAQRDAARESRAARTPQQQHAARQAQDAARRAQDASRSAGASPTA